MASVDLASIDLATLAFLSGVSASELLLRWVRDAGHPRVRASHGYVFQHLVDGSPTVGDLARLLGMTQQGASKAVAELEALGYAERRAQAGDSRVRRVVLTPAGRQVVDLGRSARARLERELQTRVGARALRTARRVLLALLDESGGLDAVRTRRARPARP